MRVVVIGAGVAGLAVSRALREDRVHSVVTLEARPRPGGRVRSVYEDDGALAYEAGPWRVPAGHARVRALCEELGVALKPAPTQPPAGANSPLPPAPGLTTWDARALAAGDPLAADEADLATGYAGETHSASGSAPYLVDESAGFLVAPDGLSALVDALAARAGEVRYDCRVADVTRAWSGRYRVHVARRAGAAAFAEEVVEADALFVCVPPHACRGWRAFREHARSTMAAVEPGALHHVYVAWPGFPRGVHARSARSLLGQTVSAQYEGSPWFQASYTAGRLARLWQHLRLASPRVFWARLREELREALGLEVPEDAPHRSHHWPVAYHAWRAAPGFDLARAVAMAVEPNPAALPRVYLAGEAWSSHQAWMEGALQTAELALAAFARGARPRRHVPLLAPTWVRVEGRVLDVAAFAASHPGGEAALRNHLGEDVGALLAHVGHSEEAWAVVHALKREW